MARRALIVGINEYDNFGALNGAVNDAERVAEMLSKHHNGDTNYSCITLTSSEDQPVTRKLLRRHLDELFRNSNDEVLFYFSGHGTVTNIGGHIITQDGDDDDLGIPMDELLTHANRAHEMETVIILDCCMSGAMGNPSVIQEDGPYSKSLLGPNVSILAASRANEVSIEEAGQGLFTKLLLSALDGTAANVVGNITLPAIYAHIEGALGPWAQRPIYKTHTARVSIIRQGAPLVKNGQLRYLLELFEEPDGLYYLSPEHEYDHVPVTEKQKIGKLFKQYRDAGIACAATPGKDLYWTAMASEAVKLTLVGKHFWGLVEAKLI